MKKTRRAGRLALAPASVGIASAAISAAFGQTVAANDTRSNKEAVETVVVTGRKATLDVLPEKILDTPQSINVVPAEVIKQQGTSALTEALKNVPGITLNAGEGGTHGDLVNLRGFPAGDDYFMDGLRDTGLYDRDVFDISALEVYKGPASTLFGRGSTGGVINQVTKTPELFPVTDASITAGSNAELRGSADLNTVLGDTSAMRLDLMGQRDNFDGRPFTRVQRWGAAPSFAYGLGTDTTFMLKYLHQQEDNIPDYGIPFLFDKPAPVARDTYYGLPSDDRFQTDVDVVTGRVDHRINDVFTVSDTARFGSYWFDSRQTAATYGSANCFTDSSSPYYYAGATLCSSESNPVPVSLYNPLYPVQGTPTDEIWVQRDRPSSKGVITTMMNETDLTAKFDTAGITHTLVTGVEADSEIASLTRYTNQNTVILPTPLLDPDPYEAFPGRQETTRQTPVTSTKTIGVFAVDTIALGPHWLVTAAVRYDHFEAKFDQPIGTPSHFEHTDDIVSPRAAIVYKPDEDSSIYFSYGTSFDPSAENLSLAASNADLGPEKDRTFEIGGKMQVLDGLLSLTAAAFDTEMTNARITDPTNPSLQTLAGNEHVNGFEFDAQGHLTERWSVLAGYTYLDPTAVGLAGAGVHGPVPNTSHNQANLWTTYALDDRFTLGGGINYIGRVNAGTDTATVPGRIVTAHVPGAVTFDLMGEIKLDDRFTLELNGYNLADKFTYMNSYFTRPGENHTVPAPGRTFLLTLEASL